MVFVSLSSNKNIEISEGSVLDDPTFELLLQAIQTLSVSEILEISYLLRFNCHQSIGLLDVAEKKAETATEVENVKVQRIGLLIQHGLDAKQALEGLQYTDDRRYEFLKAVFLLNSNQVEDAQFYFEKLGYKRGVEMCEVMGRNMAEMSLSTDPIVKCYYSSENWDEFNSTVGNKDFLYTIGKSPVFDNPDCLDVQLKHIEADIETETDPRH